MKTPSDTVRIPRFVAERILRDAETISKMDASVAPDHIKENDYRGLAWAYALGRCNGLGSGIMADLHVYMKVRS